MPRTYRHAFAKRPLKLIAGGEFEFDAVSADGSIAVAISTAGGRTTGGKIPAGKLHKLRADVLFLLMAKGVKRRVLLLTDERMHELVCKERHSGRLPRNIEVELVSDLPRRLAAALATARIAAADEMADVKRVGKRKTARRR